MPALTAQLPFAGAVPPVKVSVDAVLLAVPPQVLIIGPAVKIAPGVGPKVIANPVAGAASLLLTTRLKIDSALGLTAAGVKLAAAFRGATTAGVATPTRFTTGFPADVLIVTAPAVVPVTLGVKAIL